MGIFFMVQILLLNLRKYFGAIKLSELLLSIVLSFIPLGADKLNCTLIWLGHCTEVRFDHFFCGEFITAIKVRYNQKQIDTM